MGMMQRLGSPFWLSLSLVATGAVGCGGAPVAAREVSASGYAVAGSYRTETPEGPPPDSALHDALSTVVGSKLKHDARLDAAARRLVSQPSFSAPSGAVLDALIRDEGMVDPVPWLSAAAGTEAGVVDALSDDVRQLVAKDTRTHYGAASHTDARGTVGVVLTTQRAVTMRPVPRRVDVGDTLSLTGTLAEGLHAPEWMVTEPGGKVVALQGPKDGTDFAVEVPLEQPGVYQVELLAVGDVGVTVVANFPVAAGTVVPTADLSKSRPAGDGSDAAAAETRLRQLVAHERAQAGLPPLTDDPALSDVALAHNLDMRDAGFVGHTSPSTGEPAARVAAAGLRAWLVRENIGRGYSAEEIHQGLMQSPGHRGNVLSADAESLGLSVIAIPEGERHALLATELFAALSRPIDLARSRASLLERIATARKVRGYAAARQDAGLMQAAQRAAESFLQDDLGKDAFIEKVVARAPLPRGSERLAGSLAILRAVGQLTDEALALDPSARRYGVGLAQGQRPDTEPDSVVLVLLFSM